MGKAFSDTLDYKDGGKYHGHIFEGERHGIGTYFYPKGGVYVGGWKNDKRDGVGAQT